MRSLYDGQENHYKKMLDLQERLRKSEEERIRLEAKFNLLVQESRNRHQSCINQLRIRYVEFLEEQRARDERNNKLLGTLDKVDSSLALMTAKTERLNILRKQYEAYLLRVYGTQRANGSVTGDSGLESQNDREISPTPVFSKSVALIRKNSISYTSPEYPAVNRKIPDFELPDTYKLNAIHKPADIQRDLSEKFAQAAAVPSFYNEVKDALKNRLYLPSYLAESSKYVSSPKSRLDPDKLVAGLKDVYKSDFSKCTTITNTPATFDLDRYLAKIKQTQADALEPEPERSIDDADLEQNTSGDVLNVTLSYDGKPVLPVAASSPSSEENALPLAKGSTSRFRALLKRQACAAENGSRNRSIDRSRLSAIPAVSGKLGGVDDVEATPSSVDKFRQSEIAALQCDIGRPFTRPATLSVDDAFAKLAIISEPRRPTLQKQNLHVIDDVLTQGDGAKPGKEKELRLGVGEAAVHGEEEENGDGIEDDYDDTVDIDSWMPDDTEQQVEEVYAQDDVRDIPRRKLESIEEVEQLDDDDDVEVDASKLEIHQVRPDEMIATGHESSSSSSSRNQSPEHTSALERLNNTCEESNQDERMKLSGACDTNEQQYANQQEGGTQHQYEEQAEYNQNYEQEQQQSGEQQQYEYSDDSNQQQYAYDANVQYPGYDGQQYSQAEYEEYMKQYQQYDPSQQYQQYQDYENGQQADSSGQAQYDPNQVYGYPQDAYNQSYDYSADQQAYVEAGYAVQSADAHRADEQEKESIGESATNVAAADESSINLQEDSKDKSKETKMKKDVIRSILDSDSESFIERNLSNTESDFDFN